eukprot:4597602-Heterocapsa_arctica.AAC.1
MDHEHAYAREVRFRDLPEVGDVGDAESRQWECEALHADPGQQLVQSGAGVHHELLGRHPCLVVGPLL